MQIHTTPVGQIEHRLRQNETIGNDHHQVRPEFSKFVPGFATVESDGLKNRDMMLQGQLFDRTRGQLTPATSGAIRLAVNRNHRMPAVQRRLEYWYGKFRSPREYDSHH
jgi:hypothetical protein